VINLQPRASTSGARAVETVNPTVPYFKVHLYQSILEDIERMAAIEPVAFVPPSNLAP
jgi:hypothetical protein